KDRAGRVGIGRTPDYFTPLKRHELACDQSKRAACVLQKGLGNVEHRSSACWGRWRRHPFREGVNDLRVLADGKVDQSSKTLFRLFGDLQAELTQRERIVFLVEHAGAERGLVSVRMRIPRSDIPAHADPGPLEHL